MYKEYLCDNCSRDHKKNSASRHHKLLDKKNMPKTKLTTGVTDLLTETCPKHDHKVLEYFCHVHSDLCCTVCLNIEHATCMDKAYVPDISRGTSNSRAYTDLVTELERLATEAINENMKINLEQRNNDNYRSKAIVDIKAGREKIEKMLDKIVKESIQKVDKLHKHNAEIIKIATQKCQTVLSDAQQIASNLQKKAKGNKDKQLFVELKLAQTRISAIEDEIIEVTERNLSHYLFEQDEKVQKIVTALSDIWSLSVKQDCGDKRVKFLREFNVKSEEDKKDCCINSIAVLPGNRIVVTDYDNSVVKLVDVKKNKVTSRLTLSSQPFDVTTTKPTQVAVALRKIRNIEVITVTDVLTRIHTIDVPGDGFSGLCYDGQHFILVYDRARAVKKVDESGRVVSTMYTYDRSDPLFRLPYRITLSRGQNVLYITDINGNTVTSMTLRGHIISVYTHATMEEPRGVTVDADGRVFVCSCESHVIHKLSATGKHGKVLLDRRHGISPFPWAVAYSVQDDTLLISSGSTAPEYCNFIKVFTLK